MPRQQLSLQQRFDRNVVRQQLGCWEWTASTNAYGYAILMVQPGEIAGADHAYPKATAAHRVSWFLAHGSLPPAPLQLDHVCHNQDTSCPGGNICLHRRCTNPEHLEAVTSRENSRRSSRNGGGSANSAKTHCPRGHEYNEQNTYIYTNANGGRRRFCRRCMRAAEKRSRSRK